MGASDKGYIRATVDQYPTGGVSHERENFLYKPAQLQIIEVLLSNLDEIDPPGGQAAHPIPEGARGEQTPVGDAVAKRPLSGKCDSSIPF